MNLSIIRQSNANCPIVEEEKKEKSGVQNGFKFKNIIHDLQKLDVF